jgi:hypothetical protein
VSVHSLPPPFYAEGREDSFEMSSLVDAGQVARRYGSSRIQVDGGCQWNHTDRNFCEASLIHDDGPKLSLRSLVNLFTLPARRCCVSYAMQSPNCESSISFLPTMDRILGRPLLWHKFQRVRDIFRDDGPRFVYLDSLLASAYSRGTIYELSSWFEDFRSGTHGDKCTCIRNAS